MTSLPRWATSDRAVLVHKPTPDGSWPERLAHQLTGWQVRAVDVAAGVARAREVRDRHTPAVVIVAGGDGTVSFAADLAADHDIPLCVLVQGTANLLASSLGLPTGVEAGIATLRDGRVCRVDVHRVGNRVSLSHLSIGVYADMARLVPAGLKAAGGVSAYLLAGIRALRRSCPFTVRVQCDDGPTEEFRCGQVMVANIGQVGVGGWSWLRAADPTDGTGHVLIHPPLGLASLPGLVADLRDGVPRAAWLRDFTDRMVLQIDRPRPVRIDGELIEPTDTVEVRLDRQGIGVVVPA